MDFLTNMNEVLDYIEQNLTGKIDVKEVSLRAACSEFNFQRIFSYITNTTLAEYIRRRRLTQAALEIKNTNHSIMDVALNYGYENQTSFARAFKTLHGINPSEVKNEGVKLKAYPPISFQISIKGETEMIYRMKKNLSLRFSALKQYVLLMMKV